MDCFLSQALNNNDHLKDDLIVNGKLILLLRKCSLPKQTWKGTSHSTESLNTYQSTCFTGRGCVLFNFVYPGPGIVSACNPEGIQQIFLEGIETSMAVMFAGDSTILVMAQ